MPHESTPAPAPGQTRSRKCIRPYKMHGLSYAPDFYTWKSMMSRCRDPKNPSYHHYGARGIRVCQRWIESPQAFFDDMGPRPSSRHSLDRIDNDGNYEPGNCRWATPQQQMVNRRVNRHVTHDGVTRTISEWASSVGMSRGVLRHRIALGWDFAKALSTPSRRKSATRDEPMRQLTKEKVIELRNLSAAGWSATALAGKFDVSISTVYHVINRRTWKSI